MSEWQPIETALKDGSSLLLFAVELSYSDTPQMYVGRWSTTAWWGPAWVAYEEGSDTEYLEPTHWMPLPDPPKEAA